MTGKNDSLQSIIKNISNDNIEINNSEAILLKGDSLSIIKKFPDHSISLILTDPPYHTTKKGNIFGDTAFSTDDDYLAWLEEYIMEWKRILKPSGAIYCFCSPKISSRIELLFMKEFNILSQIVWTKPNEAGFDGWKQKMKKEALRQWYPQSERIIFAEPSYKGNLKSTYFGNFLKDKRLSINMTAHKLAELTGFYGKVNHGGAISNWEAGRNIPNEEQYNKLCNILTKHGVSYMPNYSDVIRPFNINKNVEYTDIWNFKTVRAYQGKHPAEKPLDLLEHAILASTLPNDIVLDCFSGSGNTSIAALNTNRKSIAIEIENKWIESAKEKLNNYQSREIIDNKVINFCYAKSKNKSQQLELSLS